MKKIISENYLIFLFFSLIFIFICFLGKNAVMYHDEIFFHTFLPYIQIYKDFYYGTWYMETVNLLFFYIPDKLNLNIQDAYSNTNGIVRAIIITAYFVYCYKFLRLNARINKMIVILILVFFGFLFSLYSDNLGFKFELYTITGFFRYILTSFLITLLCFYFYKYLKTGTGNIKLLCFFSFLTAASSELAAGILLVAFFLFALYSYFYNKSFLRYSLLVFGFLCAGLCCLIISPGFISHLTEKSQSVAIEKNIDVLEYAGIFLKNTLWHFIVFFILYILMLIICIKNKVLTALIVFPSALITALYLIFAMFILPGKSYFETGKYWISHSPFYSLFFLVFMTALFMLFIVVSGNYGKKFQNVLTVILVSVLFFMLPGFIQQIKYVENYKINIRNNSYMRDKIRMFWNYAGREVYMPYAEYYDAMWGMKEDIIQDVKNTEYDKDAETVHKLLDDDYYGSIYKIPLFKNSTQSELTYNNKDAFERFEVCGGTIDEIYSGKYKFSNLSNKEFVLNRYEQYKEKCPQPYAQE